MIQVLHLFSIIMENGDIFPSSSHQLSSKSHHCPVKSEYLRIALWFWLLAVIWLLCCFSFPVYSAALALWTSSSWSYWAAPSCSLPWISPKMTDAQRLFISTNRREINFICSDATSELCEGSKQKEMSRKSESQCVSGCSVTCYS